MTATQVLADLAPLELLILALDLSLKQCYVLTLMLSQQVDQKLSN